MLDSKYFVELGQPSARRLQSLPVCDQIYFEQLKREAIYWHARSEGRHVDLTWRIRTNEPSAERLQSLPVWAQEWINTLKFEVVWWRDLVGKKDRAKKQDQVKSGPARPAGSLF